MLTGGTLFTGGGGADIGMAIAGVDVRWGLEYDPEIAAVANHNLDGHVRVMDILEADPRTFERVDVLHASPPCPNFSVAKVGRKEADLDIALADKVMEFVRVIRPRVFTLENVYGYRKSESYRIITAALDEMGYTWDMHHVNFADYGVPQTRRRLILRAVMGDLPPMPEKGAWIGWYAAVEDLIDTLPESQFAEWQLKRMPEKVTSAFLIGGANTSSAQAAPGVGVSEDGEPTRCVNTSTPLFWRAFITDSRNARTKGRGNLTICYDDEPIFTLTATNGEGRYRTWLSCGKVVKMTVHALARFQTLPDWYEFNVKPGLACKIIGNAVPPVGYGKILAGLL